MPEPVPYYADESVTLYLGDCLDVLRGMPECSVDAIVTDPPAGIGFMLREWDDFRRARNPADVGRDDVFGRTSARGPEYGRRDRDRFVTWLTERLAEAMRVLKPGGHALVWSIPRTAHWTAWAVEDAGFEIRDAIPHLFGSGFPKSRNVSADIDRMAGAERKVIAPAPYTRGRAGQSYNETRRVSYDYEPQPVTAPATPEAARWDGWGTALKPGQELWWLARKPLAAGTVAGNVLEWGTGALNIAGCKVAHNEPPGKPSTGPGGLRSGGIMGDHPDEMRVRETTAADVAGRWPANVVFTHSAACQPAGTRRVRNRSGSVSPDVPSLPVNAVYGERERVGWQAHGDADGMETVEAWVCAEDCPVGELDRQSGVFPGVAGNMRQTDGQVTFTVGEAINAKRFTKSADRVKDFGGASRFFPVFKYQAKAPASERPRLEDGTAHETVKPLGLISWLIRLITPPGGTVLDPFAGSGTTGEACIIEGFSSVLIEQDPASAELIRTRLSKPIQPLLFGGDIG